MAGSRAKKDDSMDRRLAGGLAGLGAYQIGKSVGFLMSANAPRRMRVLPKALGLLSGSGTYSATTYSMRSSREKKLNKEAELFLLKNI